MPPRPSPAELSARLEMHQAEAWAACMAYTAERGGNPLGAVVDRSAAAPFLALCALDSAAFNRVIGLGCRAPSTPEDLAAAAEFYRSHGQARFRVDVAPPLAPRALPRWVRESGMQRDPPHETRVWRWAQDPLPPDPGLDVRELGIEHAEAVAEVNLAAWGAWGVEPSLAPWFAASVGREGFRHYGVFVGDRLVSCGALFVSGDPDFGQIGWLGFGATHPRFRRQGRQGATLYRRLRAAADLGCRIVHAEVVPGEPYGSNASFRNLLARGFQRLYDKDAYSPAVSSAAK